MIFDGVVSSAFEEFRNINPSVFIGFMSLKEEFFFLLSPRLFVDFRVQLVMPSLSALFS